MSLPELVYPGHPVHIAMQIMALYPSHTEAYTRPEGQQFSPALADDRISGAGGAVYSGLYILKEAENDTLGRGPEGIWKLATHLWNEARVSDHPENREAGNKQADELKDQFVETLTRWLVR